MSFRSLLDGVRFLTVVPLAQSREPDLRAATGFFPLIGLMIGAVSFALMSLPIAVVPRAALVLAAWTFVSGAFHEDGWIDCMDAAFAPVDRDRRHAILKDPLVGAHGLVAAVVLLIVRFAVLTAVPPTAVLVAPIVGRWGMTAGLAYFRPAGEHGLGATLSASPRWVTATVTAILILGAIGASTDWSRVVAGVTIGVAAGLATGLFFASRFDGLTGDGYGSVGLIAETGALFAYLEWAS